MKYCSFCGTPCEDFAGYCQNCGTRAAAPTDALPAYSEMPVAFCKQCGEKAVGRYCAHCGALLRNTELKSAPFSLSAVLPKHGLHDVTATKGIAVLERSMQRLQKIDRDDVMQGVTFTAALTILGIFASLLLFSFLKSGDVNFSFAKVFSYLCAFGYGLRPIVASELFGTIRLSVQFTLPSFFMLFTLVGIFIAEKVRGAISKKRLTFSGLLCCAAVNAGVSTLVIQFSRFSVKQSFEALDHEWGPPPEILQKFGNAILALHADFGIILPFLTIFAVTFVMLAICSGFITRRRAEEHHIPVLGFCAGAFRLLGNVMVLSVPAFFCTLLVAALELKLSPGAMLAIAGLPLGCILGVLISGGSFCVFDATSNTASLIPVDRQKLTVTILDAFHLDSALLSIFLLLAFVFVLTAAFRQLYRLWGTYQTPHFKSAILRSAAFAGTYAAVISFIGTWIGFGVQFSVRLSGNKKAVSALKSYLGLYDFRGNSITSIRSTAGGFLHNAAVLFMLFFAIALAAYFVQRAMHGRPLLPVLQNRLLIPAMAVILTLGAGVGTSRAAMQGNKILDRLVWGIYSAVDDLGGVRDTLQDFSYRLSDLDASRFTDLFDYLQ